MLQARCGRQATTTPDMIIARGRCSGSSRTRTPKFKMHFGTQEKDVNIDVTGFLDCAKVICQYRGCKAVVTETVPESNLSRDRVHDEPRDLESVPVAKSSRRRRMKTKAKDAGSKAPPTVNTICPGTIMSRIMCRTIAAIGGEEVMASGTALRRLGAPEDVAGMCLFLRSKAGAYLMGMDVLFDGGSSWTTSRL